MNSITKERIELFIKNPLENGLTRSEQMEVARIALASLEAKPVAWKVTFTQIDRKYNTFTGMYSDKAEVERWVRLHKACNFRADITPLYMAPPAPVIQADVAQAIENLRQKLVECNRYNYCADAVKGVEDACHAAMLQGGQPVSQTYKLPVNTPCQDAPAHIWLQTAGVWPEDGELSELTWCSHNQHHDDTLYVRADLVNGNYPVTPDGWISCSVRMPEKGQNVLISVNFDSSLVEPLICSARYTGSTFRRGDATVKPGNGIEQATHWMPLPEPPQEVS
ncbi:TPA: DUF551 domain-containing protein [Escherichia coli]|nr:DUF551 domain-containing protein [Escherichia coli]HDH7616095.1 DUF551 domain-containing protein [Escherichia coli]